MKRYHYSHHHGAPNDLFEVAWGTDFYLAEDIKQLAAECIPFVEDEVHWHANHKECEFCGKNKALLAKLKAIVGTP